MDNNISLQIQRLIDLDRKAVELAEKRETDLKNLEEKHKTDMDRVNSMLQLAKEEAKRVYNERLQGIQKEVEALSAETNKKLIEMEQAMSQRVDELAQEVWSKVLESIK